MEIYLIRHPKPAVAQGICYGHSDIPLAEGWRENLDGLLQQLPVPQRVYTSPLLRCRELAGLLAKEPVVDADLMELNFGLWEGQPWDQLPEDELRIWSEDVMNIAPPCGETGKDLALRSGRFMDKLKKAGEDAIIVTHTGWIRTLLSQLLQSPIELAFALKIDFCGLSHISFQGRQISVNFMNRI